MGTRKKTKSPVGIRLRQARAELGLSQKDLGIKAGIDPFSASPRINQYEQDTHMPDYSTAIRLAKVLEIPVTYLYADNDELAECIRLYGRASQKTQLQIRKLLNTE